MGPSYPEKAATKNRSDGLHRRRSAEELNERIAIPLDPAVVIAGIMQVDAEKVREAEPKRDRTKRN